MNVLLVCVLLMLATATGLAYGPVGVTDVRAIAMQMAGAAGEPAALLLSGSLMLGLAGVVRRFTV